MQRRNCYRQKKYLYLKKNSSNPAHNACDDTPEPTDNLLCFQDDNSKSTSLTVDPAATLDASSNVTSPSDSVTPSVSVSPIDCASSCDNEFYDTQINQSVENENNITVDNENSTTNDLGHVDETGLRPKLRQWATENLDTLRLNVITKLLKVLISEGHHDLPKTAQTLLGTVHVRMTQVMACKSGNNGEYIYLGIKNALIKQINSRIYTESKISVLIHIDGMQVYNSSSTVIWPILMKIIHENYISKPIVIGLYCGDSKPESVELYLHDFVQEANELNELGVKLDEKQYSFKILGIVADAQARSYIKCCKSAGGFWACERCIVKGTSAGIGKKKTRIYPDMHANKRDKDSFNTKKQQEHHLANCQSPLILLNNFDPVRDVILDSMHLLYSRVMSRLLNYWVVICNPSKLKLFERKKLAASLKELKHDIPIEFQRTNYDLNNLAKWKATMLRFFLLYCGPVVLKYVLSTKQYRHFLLLSVASRILNDKNLAVKYADYADELLKLFFLLLPNFYGQKSQVLSMHNLIHLADDVKHFQTSLVDLSAFWGENYIGLFRRLIKSPKKPLTQVVNRLSEIETKKNMQVVKRLPTIKITLKPHSGVVKYNQKKFKVVSTLMMAGYTLKLTHPNNIVLLNNGKVFKISEIYVREGEMMNNLESIGLIGFEGVTDELFNYPTSSTTFGFNNIRSFKQKKSWIFGTSIKAKCVMLGRLPHACAISLLHS